MESDEFDIEEIQEENIEEQEIEVEQRQRPLHQTKRGRKKISYKRPNRNYAKQTRWTFEMNKDVYECYLQAERDKPGYMKKLKALWDEIRPEYSHLSDKNLRDRVDRIIKKNLLADYITGQRKLANSDSENEPDISEALTPTSRFVHETTEGEPLNDEQMIDENEKGQENNTPINTEQDRYMLTNAEAQELFDRIKEKWDNYFQKYKEMDLENREFTTRISRNLSNLQWTITNEIVDKHLKDISEVREVNLWDLNVCYYVSAVTLLDCNGLLNWKEIKRREKPGWLIQAESKIDAIRKHLSRIDVVLKCKEKKQFTKRQINIERQVRKRFGRTTKEDLEESKMKLKQSLKCETEKMRRRKVIEERKKISRKFSTNPKSFIVNSGRKMIFKSKLYRQQKI